MVVEMNKFHSRLVLFTGHNFKQFLLKKKISRKPRMILFQLDRAFIVDISIEPLYSTHTHSFIAKKTTPKSVKQEKT